MPPVSQAQRAWAWSNKDKDPAAAEFAEADKGGKLPARKPMSKLSSLGRKQRRSITTKVTT